ncbi:MAG: hypothetical protein IKD69_08195, partial [Solobacterium sp.]|nr:hypothetical protein [Solobacterium sp.]
ETAQVRVKRHIVGRLAEDGSIVPTGRRGRPKKEYDGSSDQDRYDALLQQLRQKDAQLQMLRNSLRDAVRANEEMMTMLQRQNERLNRLLDEE